MVKTRTKPKTECSDHPHVDKSKTQVFTDKPDINAGFSSTMYLKLFLFVCFFVFWFKRGPRLVFVDLFVKSFICCQNPHVSVYTTYIAKESRHNKQIFPLFSLITS